MSSTLAYAALETLLDDSEPLKCQSADERHDCTVIARWICHGHFHRFWCDGRYAKWMRDGPKAGCPECDVGAGHWKVLPL